MTRHLKPLGTFIAALLLGAVPLRASSLTVLHSFGVLSKVTGLHPEGTLVQDGSGTLYGISGQGEGNISGVIFKIQPDGTGFTALKYLTNASEGSLPQSGLILSGSTLYGTFYQGGLGGAGAVFKINTSGGGFTDICTFSGSNGANPGAALLLSGGVLYGTTVKGGASNQGTVFKINTSGAGFQTLYSLRSGPDGASPYAPLAIAGNRLYGTAYGGGAGFGTVFALDTDGSHFANLFNFDGDTNGSGPQGGVVVSDGFLFGTARYGGQYSSGTIFRLKTDGSEFTNLFTFTGGVDGGVPFAGLVISSNTLYGTCYYGGEGALGVVFKIGTDGSSYTNLYNFSGDPDGSFLQSALLLSGTTLYGVTSSGGHPDGGTIFKLDIFGNAYSNIFNFNYSEDAHPDGGVVLGGNTLYGTTALGGPGSFGAVYSLNTNGSAFTNLYGFSVDDDGANPECGLVLSGGTLYGTTEFGSAGTGIGSVGIDGTLFKININGAQYAPQVEFLNQYGYGGYPAGRLLLSGGAIYGTTYDGDYVSGSFGTVFQYYVNNSGLAYLHAFSSTDGAYPAGAVVLSGNSVYGTTSSGGEGGNGTVYAITNNGTGFKTLYSFTNPSTGANPLAGLVSASNMLYGTTSSGGSFSNGTIFAISTNGSAFTNIHHFAGSDGANPRAELVLSGDTLYGTTQNGGTYGMGTIFQVKTNGAGFANYSFAGPDGAHPFADLILVSNTVYGTTSAGGAIGDGVVFAYTFPPRLQFQLSGPSLILSWTDPTYSLQTATALPGPFSVVSGGSSPYTNAIAGRRFFRLQQN